MEKRLTAMTAEIAALHYLVTELATLFCGVTGTSPKLLAEKARHDLTLWPIQGLKPEWSDHLSDETLQSVEALLRVVESRLAQASRNSG